MQTTLYWQSTDHGFLEWVGMRAKMLWENKDDEYVHHLIVRVIQRCTHRLSSPNGILETDAAYCISILPPWSCCCLKKNISDKIFTHFQSKGNS